MKLHLPKRLFTALLTAITLAAAPAAFTFGSAAWGVTNIDVNTPWTGGDATDKGGISVYNNAELTITDGAYQSESAKLELKGGGNLTMNGGSLDVYQIHVHNADATTTETLTLAGGVINVLQEFQTANNNSTVLIGHWPSGLGKVKVTAGTLNVLGGYTTVGWDSSGILSVSGSGVVNTMGIALRKDNSSGVELSGGRLNVGTLGIKALDKGGDAAGKLNLRSGTLGVLSQEGWSLGQNISTTIGNITIDTDVWDAAAKATATGDAAGSANISLLGDLTAISESASITLAGSGSLTIDHTWDGTLNLADGATAKVYLSDVDNFDIVGYIDATGTVSTSGFTDKVRVSDSGSKFYDNKVYIGETAYTVTDGVAEGVHTTTSIFYVNEDLEYNSTTMAGASGFSVSANNKLTFNGGTIEYNSLQGRGTTAIQNQGVVKVTSPLNYEGLIEIDGGSSALKLSGSGGSTISSLLLKNGGTLTFLANTNAYTHTLTNVEVNKSGTIFVSADNAFYQASVDIANLTNSVDEEGNVIEGTVTLKSEYRNSPRNVFNLNGGDFHGTINFYSGSSASSNATRKHALNINSSTAAKNAVINISDSLNSGVTMALGIGAPKVTVKGITGGTSNTGIYSGSQAFNSSDALASDGTRRTLIVDTPADDAVTGGYSTVATVGSNLNLIKKGEGSQAFTGNMSAFNGIIDVQEGTLTIGAADGSTATKLGLGGTISNAGTLNLYTNATANKANLFEVKAVTGVTDAGFATADVTYYLVSGTGTVNLKDNATITIGGTEYALTKTGNAVTFSIADADTYYVLTGATTSGAITAATEAGKTLGKIHIAESGTLTYDSGALSNVVLNGSGTYKLGSGTTTLTTGVTLGGGWTGVVLINGTGNGTNFETLNNGLGAQTTLGFEAAAGYLWSSNGNTGKFTADVFLRNGEGDNKYAMKLDNGTSSDHADVEFSGKIMGDGDIWYTFNGGDGWKATHTFSGDLSEWNGEFIEKANKKTVIAKFTSGGNVFLKNGTGGVKDADSSGHLYVTIDAADGSTTTFNGTIENAARVDVNSDTIFAANWTGVGTANVAEGIHMTVQGGLSNQTISIGTLSMGAGASVSLGENATLQLVNKLPSSHGKYNNGNSDQEASLDLTIQGAAGSMLSLALNTETSWNTNDTIKLRPLTADGGTVESVYIREGALANAVYNNGAVTDLGGANLTMADDTQLVLRKVLAENTNFGAGTITLEGATGMALYGNKAYTISNRIEGANGILNITGDNASSSITFTNVLQLDTLTSNRNVTLGGGTAEARKQHSIGTLSVASAGVTLGNYATLNLGGGTHSIGTLTAGSATVTLGANSSLTLGAATHAIGTLTLNSASVVEADFAYADKSLAVNSLTVASGATATLGTKQGTNIYNGYFNIKQLKGTESTLILRSGSMTSWSTVFDLGENQGEATYSGVVTLQANNGNTTATRGLILNIKNSDVLANTVLELKGTSAANITDRMGIGLNQNTTIGGIKDNADNKPSNSYILSGTFSEGYDFNNQPTSSNGNAPAVTLTIDTEQECSTSANILDKVNLQKDGAGSQTFNGDLSNFNGSIKVTGGTLALESSQAMNNAENVTVTGGTLHVSNDISTTKLAVANEGIAKFDSTLTAKSAQLGEVATITGKQDSAATMSKVQMSSAGISSAATDSTKGSISNALIDLQKATEFSISDMSLNNVSLKAAATGTELNLNNVTAEAVQLAAGQFTLGGEVALSEQTPATKAGGYTASFTTDQLNGITLNNASGAASLTVDLGELPDCLQDGKTYNITIALSGFSMAAYDGTGLLFAADSWLGRMLADQNAVYVNAGDVESATTLAANNNTVTVKYAAMTGGNVGTIITITGLTIPEPTTSTLGLVALAALVTRRRRK